MAGEIKLDWTIFCRALGRMGRTLQSQRAPAGGYAKPAAPRNALLDLILGDEGVRAAIGPVKHADQAERGVLSWASMSPGSGGGFTLRINHKGRRVSCEDALRAAIAALRKVGARCTFHDLIRHENQNGFMALLRIAGSTKQIGFAR